MRIAKRAIYIGLDTYIGCASNSTMALNFYRSNGCARRYLPRASSNYVEGIGVDMPCGGGKRANRSTGDSIVISVYICRVNKI